MGWVLDDKGVPEEHYPSIGNVESAERLRNGERRMKRSMLTTNTHARRTGKPVLKGDGGGEEVSHAP